MRYAFLAGINGNLQALEAVLADIKRHSTSIDSIYVLGNIIGWGPEPEACLELVIEHAHGIISGSQEKAALHPESINGVHHPFAHIISHWNHEQISGYLGVLEDLPDKIKIRSRQDIHATYRMFGVHDLRNLCATEKGIRYASDILLDQMDDKIIIVSQPPNPAIFYLGDFATPGCGNPDVTHRAGTELQEYPQIITMGAVGQPRHKSETRATYLIVDTDRRTIQYNFVAYDRATTIKQIEHQHFCPQDRMFKEWMKKMLTADKPGYE